MIYVRKEVKTMHEPLEVLAEFKQGKIVPRQIRYYDLGSACYLKKEIQEIAYEVTDAKGTMYGVRFRNKESGMLRHYRLTGRWELAVHL